MRPIAFPLEVLQAAVRIGEATGAEAVSTFGVTMSGAGGGFGIAAGAGSKLGVIVVVAVNQDEARKALDIAVERDRSGLGWKGPVDA